MGMGPAGGGGGGGGTCPPCEDAGGGGGGGAHAGAVEMRSAAPICTFVSRGAPAL